MGVYLIAEEIEKTLTTHTSIHSCRQEHNTYTRVQIHMPYVHAHTQTHKHLSLSGTGDRGIESIHIWRGNRACGDSRVVGASGGSRWCAAERNSFESRFLRVTGGATQHQAFWKASLIQKVAETLLWLCIAITPLRWSVECSAIETDSRLKFGRSYSAFLCCQDLSEELIWNTKWYNITFILKFIFHTGWSGETSDLILHIMVFSFFCFPSLFNRAVKLKGFRSFPLDFGIFENYKVQRWSLRSTKLITVELHRVFQI